MRNAKLSKIMAVFMASVLVTATPLTALATTASSGESIQGDISSQGEKVVDGDIANTTGKTGISMSDMPNGGSKLNADITVKGDVSISNKDIAQVIPQGIDIESDKGKATVNVEGSVSVEAKKDDEGEGGYYAQGISTKGATTDITIGGGVEVTSDGYAAGVASGYNNESVSFGGDNTITIGGDIKVSAESKVAEGIIIYDKTYMTVGSDVVVSSSAGTAIGTELGSYRSEGELKIEGSLDVSGNSAVGIYITTDDVETAKDNNIKVTLGGDITATGDDYATGIYVGENDKNIDITVEGDITGTTYGILSKGGNTGEAKIVSGGTVSSTDGAAIVVVEPAEGEKTPDITVWKLESSSGSLVAAYDSDNNISEDYTETVAKSINYIIKANDAANGQIKLTGATGKVTVGDKDYETANQGTEIIINVKADSGYKCSSLTAGQGILTKNADGSYTLTIPEGGGVELNAVLEKIRSSSSGGSSSSSSSSSSNIWQQDSNGWRTRKSNGSYANSEWLKLSWNGQTSWYHFNSNGYADGGWFTDTDGQKYYLYNIHDGKFGYMFTGWHFIDGKWYYFNTQKLDNASTGSLVVNGKTADGYNVDANGGWIQ